MPDTNKFKLLTKEKISRLPKEPGVYCFKKGQEILYIGKAVNIRDRVKNHFRFPSAQPPAARSAAGKTEHIGFLKTDSEIEALILEAHLIKKYQPKYNVVWRDDKNFFYIGITREDFPRVFITHQPSAIAKIKNLPHTEPKVLVRGQKSKIKNEFIGPFVEGRALKQTLTILRKVLPFRTCKTLPKKPCLWYQLNRCPAPCLTKSKLSQQIPKSKTKMKKECQKNVKNLSDVLEGKKKQVMSRLKKEMKGLSKKEQFEKAGKTRDQITSLKYILSHSGILPFCYYAPEHSSKIEDVLEELKKVLNLKKIPKRIEAYDVSNIQGKEATGAMITFVKGKPDKNFYRRFKIKYGNGTRPAWRDAHRQIIKPNDIAMLKEILRRRFQHSEWPLPDLILIDGGIGQLNAAIKIKKRIKKKIKVVSLAKKENKLYVEGKKYPFFLKTFPREIFNLILEIRDEAHRFAIKYHKKLRKKRLFDL